jgi:hypothetical protein
MKPVARDRLLATGANSYNNLLSSCPARNSAGTFQFKGAGVDPPRML